MNMPPSVTHAVSRTTYLPRVVHEIVKLASDPRTSVARLATALTKDQTVVSTVLKRANACAHGLTGKVNSLHFAVVLLGFDLLKETAVKLLINSSVRNMVNTLHRCETLWNHALRCALTARWFAHSYALCNPGKAFLSGLLHDIGYLVLNEYPVETLAGERTRSERDALSDSSEPPAHAQMGGSLASEWGLPDDLVEAIRFHHTPWRASLDPRLTATVYLAEILSKNGDAEVNLSTQFDARALRTLNLNVDALTAVGTTQSIGQLTDDLMRAPSLQTVVESFKETLVKALDELPDRQKLILALRYYEGLTFEEMSTVLDTSVADVEALHGAALERMKESFAAATNQVLNTAHDKS